MALWDQFTEHARAGVAAAQSAARRNNEQDVGPEHLLIGILRQKEGIAYGMLAEFGIDPEALLAKVEASLTPGPGYSKETLPALTAAGKKVIGRAHAEAKGMGHTHLGTEHLLLGALALDQGVASDCLREAGCDLYLVRRTLRLLGEGPLKGGPTWNRLTDLGRRAVTCAKQLAAERGENQVHPEHLLLAVLQEGGEAPRRILQEAGASVTSDELRKHLAAILTPGPGRDGRDILLDGASTRVLDLAFAEAARVNNLYVGPEHILLGVLAADGGPSGIVLRQFGPTLSAARGVLIRRPDSNDVSTAGLTPSRPSGSGPVAVRQRVATGQMQTQSSAQKPRPLWKDVLLALFLMLLFAFLLGMLRG